MVTKYNNHIKYFRLKKGLTQENVARHCNISREYYNKIENGFIPSLKIAYKIADCLGVFIDELWKYYK